MAKWKYKTGKLRGAYGETDYDKKTITIDKAKHRKKGVKRITPNKDGSEKQIITMAHELLHKAHPKMTEKQVEKLAKRRVKTMTAKAKQRMYGKFK